MSAVEDDGFDSMPLPAPPTDLRQLHEIIDALTVGEPDLDSYDDLEAMSWLLAEHRRIIERLKVLESVIVQRLIPLVPFGGAPVESVGVVQVMGGRERKAFDQPRIMSALTEAIFMHDIVTDEGEIEMSVRQAVEHTIKVMGEATGAQAPSFTSWRSGVFKRYGLKADSFANEIEPSPRSIVIRGAS